MADLEKSVAIIFEGVDQMGAGVDSATKRIDGIAGSVQSATEPMANLTKNVFAFEAALLAAGVAATGFAIKVAGDFESSFQSINTLGNLSEEQLSSLRAELLDYASTSTQSIDNLTDAFFDLVSAGNSTEEAMRLLTNAEQLAVAGKTNLATSAGALAGVLSAYGAEAGDAEQFTDALFVAMQGGITTVDQLADSLPDVTGLAAQLGISFDEIAAAASALTRDGTSTNQAVTQLGAALNSIIGPSAQAKTLAEDLGLEFNAAALRADGFSVFLQKVEEATGGSEEQMKTLFGSTQALRGVLSLTGPQAEAFAEILGNMDEKAGATSIAYDKMADNIDLGSQRIKNAMTGALIAVGTPLLDEFTGIQDAIAAIFNAIGASITDGQLQGFVERIESMMQGIERTLRDVAQNLPEALESADFSSFFNGIDLVRNAIADLFDGADLTSADGLARVIETLGLAFETLSAYTAGAITAIGPFLEQLASLTQFVLELNPAWAVAVGAIGGFSVALNTLASGVIVFTGIIKPVFGSAGIIAKAAPLVSGLVAVLSGPVGITIAAGVAGVAIAKFGGDLLGVNDRLEESARRLEEDAKRWEEFSAAVDGVSAAEYRKFADEFGYANNDVIQMVGDARQAIEDAQESLSFGKALEGILELQSQANPEFWERLAQAERERIETTRELAGEVFELATAQGEANQRMGEALGQDPWGDLRQAYLDYRDAFVRGEIDAAEWSAIQEEYNQRLAAATGEAAQSQTELAGEVLSTEEAILSARQSVLDFELAMEELASNERIRNLELFVDLRVAEIEGETARIEAAFNSINTTIESTGETLEGLYSILGSGDLSRFQEMDLEREIKRESERRDEALRLQNELTQAQIDQMRVRTEALRNGDGLINISSDGLEPALEMIMWQIIEKVQLRANAEGQEFLLGLA